MEYFLILTFLFAIGASIGWIIELFFRRFCSAKRWINPGFLVGPCLPLYGFGLASLYGMSRIPFALFKNEIINKILWIIIMCIVVTFIEYLAGLIFIKGLKTKLWDYSNRPGNIQGLVCPLFTFFWLIICAAYNLLLDPYIVKLTSWFSNNTPYSFFVGMYFGVLLIDFCYSIHLASRIKNYAKEKQIVVKWEEFKQSIAEGVDSAKSKASFLFAFHGDGTLKDRFEQYAIKTKFKLNALKNRKKEKEENEVKNA